MIVFNPLDFFQNPKTARQRQYDALRDYYLKNLTQRQASKKHNYKLSTFQTILRDFKSGKITFFPPIKKGPKRKQITDHIKEKVITLRKRNHSIYEIQNSLGKEGFCHRLDTISRILREEGFSKLPRRRRTELGLSKKGMINPPIATMLDFDNLTQYKFDCQVGGIFYFIPYILKTNLYDLIMDSSFPESSKLSKINSIFSRLALKLIGLERLSRINEYNQDTGFGFFAGLNVPPKSTATS